MGERVQVGPLIYTVFEVDWISQMPGDRSVLPKGKFAVIRLSVTNSGNRDISLPLLHLEDESGTAAMEVTEVQGIDEWLGILRDLGPAETIQGRIVFDVPPKNHRLRVTDGGTPEVERIALVTIPLRLEERQPLPFEQPAMPDPALPTQR